MNSKFDILPIGSVVLLKNANKKLMITGYCIKTEEKPNKIYDYTGCLFPEGVQNSNVTTVFDHAQIDKIFHIGYVDLDMINYIDKVENAKNLNK